MNATDTTYNPFRVAAAAAFSELSSESAHRYYSLKAQKDFQNALDTSITLCAWVFQLAELTYMMGVQCRTWCDALEANAQAPARPALMLAPAPIEDEAAEDPWEVEAEYEFVEFSPSVAAQAFTSPMLLLAPASTVICGPVWNPAPKDMHTEVERMLQTTGAPISETDVGSLDLPGATGKRTSRAKASTSKAGVKPKGTRARAKV